MAEYILRYGEEKDKEQIIRLWQASFGDGEAFVRELLDGCGLFDKAVCAEMHGEVRSCMFSFDGLEWQGRRASYLYALCTQPEFRSMGLGRAVALYAAEMAYARGARLCLLRPADEGLEGWYSDMGACTLTGLAPERLWPSGGTVEKAVQISPEEYLRLRSGDGWTLPLSLLLAQDCIHRHCGGAFLKMDSGALCAEKVDGKILLRELSPGLSPEKAAASAREFFGAEEIYILRKSSKALPLMCLPPFPAEPLPETEPVPFTLD